MTSQNEARSADAAGELAVAEEKEETAGRRIRRALRACPTLQTWSSERDALWLTVQAQICTQRLSFVSPFGSSTPVMITEDQATDELISAMEWLIRHEDEARLLAPLRLFVMLRGVATRSKRGSARVAKADLLHGLTHVPPGQRIAWKSLDGTGVA